MADVLARARSLGSSRRVYPLCGTLCTVEAFFADLERLGGKAAPRYKLPWRLAWLAALVDHHGGRLLLKRPLGSIPDPVVVEMGSHTWNTRSRSARKDLNVAPRPGMETLRDTIEWLVHHGGVPQSLSS